MMRPRDGRIMSLLGGVDHICDGGLNVRVGDALSEPGRHFAFALDSVLHGHAVTPDNQLARLKRLSVLV
jgi:hypothetical protein